MAQKWSVATETEKAQKLLQRWEDLKKVRQPFFDQWQDIANYVSPHSGRFNVHNHGQDRNMNLIFDSEASRDLLILASGLMSGVSSPARPFFKLQPNNEEFEENHNVLTWCQNVEKLMLKVFHASNTYNSLHKMYLELALFGISADLIYAHDSNIITHHLLTGGEFAVATNENGEIDTLYRNFELTTMQAIKAFGYETCPKEIQYAYDKGLLQQYWEFIHAIEPRIDRDFKKFSNKDFEWGSYYICASTAPKVLKESGFNYFPAIVPRWEVLGYDAYGSSPSMICLPDIRQLQHETYRKAELIDLYTKPPLQVPSNARQNPISLSAGALNFTQNTASENSIRPILSGAGDLNALMQDIAQIKQAIRQGYFVDLFQMVGSTAGDRRTTVEIYALQQEQMLSLGSVVERVQNECLGQLINITFRQLMERDLLPETPPELQQDSQGITPKFTSVLAQSQESVDINAVDRFFSALSIGAQVMPEVLDRVDADGYVDEYRDRLGIAPRILRSKEEADKIRQSRADAQQAQQEQEQAMIDAQTSNVQAQAQKGGAEAGLAMAQLDDLGGGSLL